MVLRESPIGRVRVPPFMDLLGYLRAYDPDRRFLRWEYAESSLEVNEGDRVAVVLFSFGGPESADDVEPFLYHLLMDPALLDLPVGGRIRHWLARTIARVRARSLRENYETIGGGSPLTRLTAEQAQSLQRHLNDQYGDSTGIHFRTYRAMRYWHPFSEEAAHQMEVDGVDKVVLLPLYPQYSASMSGSSLAHWKTLDQAGEIPSWPTTAVPEYAAHPKYVQAVSERIDEALQRFPKERRDHVPFLFSALSSPLGGMSRGSDSYCCLIHSTVEQVMKHRAEGRPYHTAFQSVIGPDHWLDPSTPDRLRSLAAHGEEAVLVIPISLVTEHYNTSYELDIELRTEAEAHGIDHYEVTAGLNTHPLFIEALAEAAVAQLELPVDTRQLRFRGDGVAQAYPLRPLTERPRHSPRVESKSCPICGSSKGARQWTLPNTTADADLSPERPPQHDASSGQVPEPSSSQAS